MNRIVLIGNGFDLAHGMETSYNQFLKDYWSNTISLIRNTPIGRSFENEQIKISSSPAKFIVGNTFQDLKGAIIAQKTTLQFKNRFLKIISEKSSLNNWVDVENEYYTLLKRSYHVNVSSSAYSIADLNSDFDFIKELLRDYLIRIEEDFDKTKIQNSLRIKNIIGGKIYSYFKLKDFTEDSLNKRVEIEYKKIKQNIDALNNPNSTLTMSDFDKSTQMILNQINLNYPKSELKELLLSEIAKNYFNLVPEHTLFLNFNYTFTELLYKKQNEFNNFRLNEKTLTEFIHIHGSLIKDDNNPIIFGYGDEIDDDYKSIERLNDNAYLENIKSIKYLETDNYKKLLNFVNSGGYQIFIFGHSCGISDRTLLNTLFEHQNCSSIKPFYYQQENKDNYSEIVRNISRNFNDKVMMRDKVVNKIYCEPLS